MAIDFKRETCQICERQIRMTRGSRIWTHNRPATEEDSDAWPRRCRGSGQMSKERVALLLKMDKDMHEAREKEQGT